MTGANDSLIIGCVLVLVFGALFYYLHSRLLYAEKRINVMETILLDFKNTSETFFTPSESPTYGVQEDENLPIEPSQVQQHQQQQQSQEPLVADEVVNSTNTVVEQQQQQQEQDQILRNYESMNIKELQQEARNRNISGVSGMRRKELIQALRKSDDETTQRPPTVIEELNAPQSSLTESAELVEPISTN